MKILRILRFAKNLTEIRNLRSAWVLSGYGALPLQLLDFSSRGVYLKGLAGVDILTPECHFLIQGLPLLQHLLEVGFAVDNMEDGGFKLIRDNLSLPIRTWEEIFIVHEIFFNLEYDFQLGEKTRIVDIGGNTGIASVYFSSRPEISQVIAYELFPDTAERFRETIAMNPDFASKIELRMVGLSDTDAELELDYCPDVKGSVGFYGVADHAVDGRARMMVEKRKVQVVSAVAAFEELLNAEPAMSLVAKIDCEGAEYQIIDSLASAGMLSKVEAFLIEWHGRGYLPITEKLIAAGHAVWLRSHPGAKHGMIYSCLRRALT